jgi:hypothetical protein
VPAKEKNYSGITALLKPLLTRKIISAGRRAKQESTETRTMI